MLRLADVQHAYIDRMIETLPDLKPGEIAGAARNAATVSALYVDKHSSPLRERPSHVQPHTDVDHLLSRMQRLLGTTVINSTAVDVTEIEAVALKTPRDHPNARVVPQLDAA